MPPFLLLLLTCRRRLVYCGLDQARSVCGSEKQVGFISAEQVWRREEAILKGFSVHDQPAKVGRIRREEKLKGLDFNFGVDVDADRSVCKRSSIGSETSNPIKGLIIIIIFVKISKWQTEKSPMPSLSPPHDNAICILESNPPPTFVDLLHSQDRSDRAVDEWSAAKARRYQLVVHSVHRYTSHTVVFQLDVGALGEGGDIGLADRQKDAWRKREREREREKSRE